MFPSNDPFSYFGFENNQTSKQETNIMCDYYNLPKPPPFDDYQIFPNQPHDFPPESLAGPQPEPVEMDLSIKTKISRKIIGKRGSSDRHSKIKTARGLRDRRIRLSLQVAKSFFPIQDMLGFETASQTVGWLLNQATEEINEIATKGEEVVLKLKDENQNQEKPQGVKRKSKHFRKFSATAFHHLARERRDRARERARERTEEKMKAGKLREQVANLRPTQLGSWCQSLNHYEEHLGTIELEVEGVPHEDTYGLMAIVRQRTKPSL